jgi:hypothetical protein
MTLWWKKFNDLSYELSSLSLRLVLAAVNLVCSQSPRGTVALCAVFCASVQLFRRCGEGRRDVLSFDIQPTQHRLENLIHLDQP